MTDLLLRNLEPDLKRRIAAEARRHNLSLSEGAKLLIQRGLTADNSVEQRGMGTFLASLIPPEKWTDEFIVTRDEQDRDLPDFS